MGGALQDAPLVSVSGWGGGNQISYMEAKNEN